MSLRSLLLLTAVSIVSAQLQLTILHNNDVHSYFDPVDANTAACRYPDDPENPCYGGIGRLVSAVKAIKEQTPNTLVLYGGDIFQGYLYYTLFKWRVVVDMMNLVPYDAMALGNHEFDDGLDGLLPYLDGVNHQQLCTNIDFGPLASPTTDKCLSSVVREIGGHKIGIVGFTTPETKVISKPPPAIEFLDEVSALRSETARLKAQGVNIIIAVGHSGYHRELEMAQQLEDVDVIVGGHSHSLLYTGAAPDDDPVTGPYPTVVHQTSGRAVLVVQAYQHGKYLGVLNVTFDSAGEVADWSGNPIRLEGEQDQEAEEILQQYKDQISEYEREVIGTTLVQLACTDSRSECGLGNLIADSLVRALLVPSDGQWSQVSAAIINTGGIRSRLEPGNITLSDVLNIQPFGNTISLVTLSGETLRQTFEHSALGGGRFLQVAGFRVTYNMDCPEGMRLLHLEIVCTDCLVPRLEPVRAESTYRVVMSTFLSGGGDGYNVISDDKIDELDTGLLDVDLMRDHIEQFSPVISGIENRLVFETNLTSRCGVSPFHCHGSLCHYHGPLSQSDKDGGH
ncbi:snake venom 5'-nucleotidase-like [Amphibalanus amphitrite]|uniref:snake venom 5'-nucleotidase-like n=1 Tax=Amphibalanus amphitrite TaxID=1232801 RepID=UPI001C9031E3|nr:snake venom 5'-nucleotidase-like [Amphibalanus amphitrite]